MLCVLVMLLFKSMSEHFYSVKLIICYSRASQRAESEFLCENFVSVRVDEKLITVPGMVTNFLFYCRV